MKTERTQIHFLSDVFVAVASLDLKVPNGLRAKFPHRNIYFHGFNQSSPHKVFSDPQQAKVMNIQEFLEYMLKSSKCGPHASKMKSRILYRLRSTQKYPHFEDFFIDQRWLKFRIFYHISTPYVIIYVIKPAEGYNLFTLGSRGFSCAVSGFGHV